MKKKIILVVIVVFAVAVSGAFVLTKCLKTNSNHEQVNVVEDKDEEFNLQEEEQSKDEITTETDEIENKTTKGKSESPKEDTSKQENKSKASILYTLIRSLNCPIFSILWDKFFLL